MPASTKRRCTRGWCKTTNAARGASTTQARLFLPSCGQSRARARIRPAPLRPPLLVAPLPMVLSRYQQKSPPPLVQHETLRQPHQSAKILCPEEKRAFEKKCPALGRSNVFSSEVKI